MTQLTAVLILLIYWQEYVQPPFLANNVNIHFALRSKHKPITVYCWHKYGVRAECESFIGAFLKSRKATISFVMSVRPSGTTRPPMDEFSWNLHLSIFRKYAQKIPSVTARQTTDDNTTRRMRFACCITKVTDTHSEYVILIAFPRPQWLRERTSMIRLHVHCLSCLSYNKHHLHSVLCCRRLSLHYTAC